MIVAILRAQLLSMRGFGLTKNASAWLGAIPAAIFYFFWVAIAFGVYALFSSVAEPANLMPWLTGGLLIVFLYWQIAPVITASMGASLDLQKLIVYPIPLDKLFLAEVMLRFLTVGEMLIVLAGAGLGLLQNPALGGWLVISRMLPAWAAFILFNLLVSAGLRSLIERLFQGRRTKEVATLAFVLICALPSAIVSMHLKFDRVLPFLPLQIAFPWGAAAQMAIAPHALKFAIALAILSIWIFAAYGFGRRQFYRALRSDPYAGHQPAAANQTGRAWTNLFFRIPGRLWKDPLATMIEKELRSLSRSSGFRLVFIMGFTFSLILFVRPSVSGRHPHSFLSDHILAWISLYSLLLLGSYTFWNAFGYDRGAAQFYFSAPVSFRKVMAAKNIAAAFAQLTEVAIIALVVRLLPIPFDWAQVPEAFAVTAVSCLYLFAFGNITSVRFPVPLNPDSMNRGSTSRGMSVVFMLIVPAVFLPLALAYWGRSVFHSDLIFYLLLLVATVIGGILYWIATDSAIDVTLTAREKMLTTLSRGSGPLTTA